jgi:hypothetical protein
MTWMVFLEIWLVSGVISAAWHVIDEWWHNEVFEYSLSDILMINALVVGLCLVAGPIGLAIKIWEKYFDPSNI